MNNNDKLLKILELTAKKINPPHKKEVKAIEVEGVKKVDFGTLKPYLKYLRGYEYESDSNIAVWESGISVSGWRQVEPFGSGVINSIVVLNDKTVAVARGISVEIVDLLSGRCMQRLTHGSMVLSIALLNENTIVSGDGDGILKIWEKQNGEYKESKTLSHGSMVFSITLLNENTIVSGDGDGILKIWEKQNGEYKESKTLSHGSMVLSIALLNENTIVSGGYNGNIKIWEKQNGEYKDPKILPHGSPVRSIAILNENIIVSGGYNGNIKIWEKQNGGYKDPKILSHRSRVFSIALLNENTIVSGGDDGVLKIWDLSGKANTPKIELYDTEDEGVYQVKMDGRWQTYRTSEEWRYGDDELMYKYGWFTNGNRCVPYYCFDESEIKGYFVDGE